MGTVPEQDSIVNMTCRGAPGLGPGSLSSHDLLKSEIILATFL